MWLGNCVALICLIPLLTNAQQSKTLSNGFGEDIDWVHWDQAISTAMDLDKPIFLLIHKEWCGACKQLKQSFKTSNKRKDLVEMSQKFVMVNSENDEEPGEVGDDLYAPDGRYIPRLFLLDSKGQPLDVNNARNYAKNAHYFPQVVDVLWAMKEALRLYSIQKRKEAEDAQKEFSESSTAEPTTATSTEESEKAEESKEEASVEDKKEKEEATPKKTKTEKQPTEKKKEGTKKDGESKSEQKKTEKKSDEKKSDKKGAEESKDTKQAEKPKKEEKKTEEKTTPKKEKEEKEEAPASGGCPHAAAARAKAAKKEAEQKDKADAKSGEEKEETKTTTKSKSKEPKKSEKQAKKTEL